MKLLKVALSLMFFTLPALAQNSQCDALVVDQTGALRGQTAQVEQAAKGLINEGADVRVRVVANLVNGNLDFNEKQFEQQCPSWQSPSGAQKSTLVSLLVAPTQRKFGIYYGTAFKKAFDDHWVRIKQENMRPRFKAGDFVGGFASAEQALTARLAASKDEAVHPVQSVVNNNVQATDMHGLWKVFGWLLAIAFVVFIIYVLIKRKQIEDEVKEAQTSATLTKARVAKMILNYNADEKISTNLVFAAISEQYTELANSVSNDPRQDGLSKAQYLAIDNQYRSMERALLDVRVASVYPASSSNPTSYPDAPKKNGSHTKSTHKAAAATGTAPTPVHTHTVHERTVVVNNSNDGFVEGALLGSLLSRDRDERPKDTYTPPAPSISRDDDDDRSSGGGGSSSWSNDDSSSSSSDSGGGGSSDFGSSDSGSSDSGGGGSDSY